MSSVSSAMHSSDFGNGAPNALAAVTLRSARLVRHGQRTRENPKRVSGQGLTVPALRAGHHEAVHWQRTRRLRLTDHKVSPRFVFLDQPLETTQIGPDSFIDAYPTAAKPQFEASKAGDTVRIQLTRQDAGYQSSLEWPTPDSAPVEIGPALLDVLETFRGQGPGGVGGDRPVPVR
ncbi:hypothetical protein ACQPZX_14785 [Actinoplanes sp. CA-142083]|uniref:hypothetical protein n=1 Tax=Actinoplanes sp. CA-142083 TaxID=3239903 RepID=UPI003D9226B9